MSSYYKRREGSAEGREEDGGNSICLLTEYLIACVFLCSHLLLILQVHLVKLIVSDIAEKIKSLSSSTSPSSTHGDIHASGIRTPKTAVGAMGRHTHTLATPTTFSATPSTLPTASDVSTTSLSYQGVSSVWLQLLISKCVLQLYGREDNTRTNTQCSCRQEEGREAALSSATSKAESLKESGFSKIGSFSSSSSAALKVSIEVDILSLQVDVQEKCTDFILKVAAVESDLCMLSRCSDGSSSWIPYLVHSKGKLFSSSTSNLPDDILQVTAPGFLANQFHSPQHGVTTDIYSPCLTPKVHSNFVYLKGYIPMRFSQAPQLEVNTHPFEVVMWLPAIELALSIIGSRMESDKTPPSTVR